MAGRLESCPSVRAALQIGSSNMWTSIGSPKAKFKGYIVTTLAMGITQLMTKLTLIRQPMRVLKFYHLCDHSINNNNPTIQPYEYHYLPSTNLFNKTNLTIQQFEDHRLPSITPLTIPTLQCNSTTTNVITYPIPASLTTLTLQCDSMRIATYPV